MCEFFESWQKHFDPTFLNGTSPYPRMYGNGCRKLHLTALNELLRQVFRITLVTGMMKLGRVALGSSKAKADASKHKAMSYGRMQETGKRLREEVWKLLSQAEAADAEGDARYGRGRPGDELPEELQRREARMQRIREARRALKARAPEQAESAGITNEPPRCSRMLNLGQTLSGVWAEAGSRMGTRGRVVRSRKPRRWANHSSSPLSSELPSTTLPEP